MERFESKLLIIGLIAIISLLAISYLPPLFSGELALNPIAFTLGGFAIRWYGLLIALAILIGYLIGIKDLKADGIEEGRSDLMYLVVVLSGIIGARLGFVLQSPSYYLTSSHNLEILKVWDGGLSIHGAIIAGVLALYIFCQTNKLKFLQVANDITPPILLAGALGRWGNYFNQEIIGKPTDLPWKMYITLSNRPAGFENEAFFHPVFLYESILLASAFIFYLVFKKFLKQYAFAYTLIIYSLIRIIVEFFRIDYHPILFSFDLAQFVSLGIILFALVIIILQKRFALKAQNQGRFNDKSRTTSV